MNNPVKDSCREPLVAGIVNATGDSFSEGGASAPETAPERALHLLDSGADWLDLGMPEALWTCRVREFGPLIVSIDAEGRNYFEEKKAEYKQHKDEQLALLASALDFRE